MTTYISEEGHRDFYPEEGAGGVIMDEGMGV